MFFILVGETGSANRVKELELAVCLLFLLLGT